MLSDNRNKLNILEGKKGEWVGLTSRIVRVFLSSTFTDMCHERNALMESVYPQLKQYCRENYNVEFQVVDMRWGVHKDAYNDHLVIDLCLKEIENCQRLSVGPNFVVLIGQKYGFRPLPSAIPKDEFENLLTINVNQQIQDNNEQTIMDSKFQNGGSIQPTEALHINKTVKDSEETTNSVQDATLQLDMSEVNKQLVDTLHGTDTGIQVTGSQDQIQQESQAREGINSEYILATKAQNADDNITVTMPKLQTWSNGTESKTKKDENSILNAWYKLDENCLIPEYCLQPVHEVLTASTPQLNSNESAKTNIESEWSEVCERLKLILRERAKVSCEHGELSEESYRKYYISVTEDEISHGILNKLKTDAGDLKTLSVFRTIDNIQYNLKDDNSPSYIDMIGGEKVDEEAQNLLNNLKDRVEKSLSEKNAIIKFDIQWGKGEGVKSELHREYLTQFCGSFREKLRDLIDSAMVQRGGIREDPLMTEVLQHAETRKTWGNIVIGRAREIDKMCSYMIGRSNQPMVVFGESGSGKTALMARAAQLCCEWKPKAMVLYRFLGTTPKTSTVGALIESLSRQISVLYGKSQDLVPSDYTQLIPYFHQLLKLAAKDKPLAIILDSLDQLSPDRNAYRLLWLPMKLPPHVKLLMSAIPTVSNIATTIKETIKNSDNFTEIKPLGENASLEIIMEKLNEIRRTITPQQQNLLTGLFTKCSLPLFSKLTFENVRYWKSYNDYEKTYSAADVESAVTNFLDRLEKKHGQILVSRYLAYLTASKNGLSDVELEDILSLDDDVLNEVFFFWIPPIRRIPPSILTHIKVDLHSYVITREANEVHVNSWYHRKFSEVAAKKYLNDGATRKIIHSNLADYFSGVWGGGRKKPFRYSEKQVQRLKLVSQIEEADRKVPSQPLVFESQFDSTNSYNLRKLNQLPRHLMESKRLDELLNTVVFNYRWLHTRLRATNIRSLRRDLREASKLLPDNEALQCLHGMLRLSSSSLQKNPDSLAAEIMCRLLWYYETHAELRLLIQQCETDGITESVLIPVDAALDAPSDALIYSLEGHNNYVTDIQFTSTDQELFSVARDGSICQWDINSAEILRRIDIGEIDEGRPAYLMISKDDTYIAVSTISAGIKFQAIYVVKTGDLVKKWQTARTATYHNEMLSKTYAILDGVLLYLDDCSVLHYLEDYQEFKYYVIVDVVPNEQFIVFGLVNETAVYNIKTCDKVMSLPSVNIASSMVMTQDNTTAVIGYSSDCLIKCFDIDPVSQNFGHAYNIFDIESSFPDRTFEMVSNFTNEVSELVMSKGDSLVLAMIKRGYPVIWNMTTGEGLCMSVPQQELPELFYWTSFSFNSTFVISISTSSKIHVWNAKSGDLLVCHTAHHNRTKELLCGSTMDIAASVATCENVIKVWDIGKLVESRSNFSAVNKTIKDILLPLESKRYAFLISAHPQGNLFYRYINYFTLEIVDLVTRERTCIMPFKKYGNFFQLASNSDGSIIVYMVSSLMHRQFTVLSLTNDDLFMSRSMPGCVEVKMSKCGLYLLCIVKKERKTVTRLFDCRANRKIVTFRRSDDAAFLTSTSVLYLTNDDLMVYNIQTKQQLKCACKFATGINYGKIHVVEAKNVVIITTVEKPSLKRVGYVVNVNSYQIVATMRGVSKGGVCDVSDNGEMLVDTEIQIFRVDSGELMHDFNAESGEGGANMIRFSHEGKYVIWHEKNIPDTIKVARISTGQVYASCNLHSSIKSLAIHKEADIVAIGTNEGHLHLFKIKDDTSDKADNSFDMKDGETVILDQRKYGEMVAMDQTKDCQRVTLDQRKDELIKTLLDSQDQLHIHPLSDTVIADLKRIYRVSNIKHLDLEEVEDTTAKSRVCTIS